MCGNSIHSYFNFLKRSILSFFGDHHSHYIRHWYTMEPQPNLRNGVHDLRYGQHNQYHPPIAHPSCYDGYHPQRGHPPPHGPHHFVTHLPQRVINYPNNLPHYGTHLPQQVNYPHSFPVYYGSNQSHHMYYPNGLPNHGNHNHPHQVHHHHLAISPSHPQSNAINYDPLMRNESHYDQCSSYSIVQQTSPLRKKQKPSKDCNGFELKVCYRGMDFYMNGTELIKHETSRSSYSSISDYDIHQMKEYFYTNSNKADLSILFKHAAAKNSCHSATRRREDNPLNMIYFYCKGQKHTCGSRYLVMRFKGKFAFYKNGCACTHVIFRPGKLPPAIRIMAKDNYKGVNPVTSITAHLDSIKDQDELKELLGPGHTNILNKKKERAMFQNQIKNCVDYEKKKEKKALLTKSSIGTRRTVKDVIDTIEKSRINLESLVEEHAPSTFEEISDILQHDNEVDYGIYYTDTDLGRDDSSKFDFVQWMKKKDTLKIASEAIKMCEKTGLPLMLQADYTHSKLKDKAVVGLIGIADLFRQFHTIAMDWNKSENQVGSVGMMKAAVYVLRLMGHDETKHGKIHIMVDGSESLRKACEKLGCIPHRCAVHIFRMPDMKQGKTGFSGTAGSLYTFLMGKRLDERTVFIIRLAVYMFYFFPDDCAYVNGRKIFVYDFNYGSFYGLDSSKRANIRKHFFKFYLPEKPEWGYAGTEPGHVKSTNG